MPPTHTPKLQNRPLKQTKKLSPLSILEIFFRSIKLPIPIFNRGFFRTFFLFSWMREKGKSVASNVLGDGLSDSRNHNCIQQPYMWYLTIYLFLGNRMTVYNRSNPKNGEIWVRLWRTISTIIQKTFRFTFIINLHKYHLGINKLNLSCLF
jgi:hypothetical protein